MFCKGFEGWYFKHQADGLMLAFIPGISKSGAFVQVIHNDGAFVYDMPDLKVKNGVIITGNCTFSQNGIAIDLPNFQGELHYKDLTPLASDIMGPFQYLPMQCRHGVLSMHHTVNGQMHLPGKQVAFSNASGYIEKDSGRSFPRSYLWLQCNSFAQPCSIMVSIAHIPFCGFSFTGCICAIVHHGNEYRLATYHGVKILKATPYKIVLKQNDYLLEIEMRPANEGHTLKSPNKGQMSHLVKESCNAFVHATLRKQETIVFDLESKYAAYECML